MISRENQETNNYAKFVTILMKAFKLVSNDYSNRVAWVINSIVINRECCEIHTESCLMG